MRKILLVLLLILIGNILSIEFTLEKGDTCAGVPATILLTVSDFSPEELNYVGILFNYSAPITAVSHDCTDLPTEIWFQSSEDYGSSFSFAASDLSSTNLINSPCTLAVFDLGVHTPGAIMSVTASTINYEFEGSGSTTDYDLAGFSNPNFTIVDCGIVCTLDTEVRSEDSLVCKNAPTQLTADAFTYAESATFIWSPGACLDDSTSANPIATPESTTTFTVYTTVSEDCFDIDTFTHSLIRPFTHSIFLLLHF